MADPNRPETRREGGLSTADLATVTEERTEERDPQLDAERYPGEPFGIRVERPEAQRQEQPAAPREPTQAAAPPPPPPQPERAAEQESPVALLSDQDSQGFQSRWEAIQIGFVDSPKDAVQQADGLVAELMKRLAESFAGARSDLEQQWSRGENVSTEDLRLALRRYRSFFDRLLSI
jgi:sRNA-binding protein